MFGMAETHNSDLVLAPDLNSFRRLPMYDGAFGNVAMFMCYVLNSDGSPCKGCTRTVLKNALTQMEEAGFSKLSVGFEPEFFLLKAKPSHTKDFDVLFDKGDYADAEGEEDKAAYIRREIMFELERVGITPLVSHHERAPSGYEITYKYSDALTSCDNLILGMHITKHVARKHGLYATFEPKPFEGINGNGLHTNISLANGVENAFATTNGISDTAKHFVAGVLKHAGAICHFTNPSEHSYRRLVKGYEAPVSICWGYHNRTAMIRVPHASFEARRIELRSPDSTMNPYLGVAAILVAGLDGIKNNLPVPECVDFDAGSCKEIPTLPENTQSAKREFLNSPLFATNPNFAFLRNINVESH